MTRELGSHHHVSTMTIQHLAAIAALRSDENGSSSHVDKVRAAHLLGFVDARDAETGLYVNIPSSRSTTRYSTRFATSWASPALRN